MKIEITTAEAALEINATEIADNIYQREDGTLVILDPDGATAAIIAPSMLQDKLSARS